jgi:hypothetical protein
MEYRFHRCDQGELFTGRKTRLPMALEGREYPEFKQGCFEQILELLQSFFAHFVTKTHGNHYLPS